MSNSWEFRSFEAGQIRNFLADYYQVDNKFAPTSSDKSVKCSATGSRSDSFFQSFASVSTPFRLTSDRKDAFTIVTCRSGAFELRNDPGQPTIRAGQAACLSPNRVFDAYCDHGIGTEITQIWADRIAIVCESMLGTNLHAPLLMDMRPFSPMLHALWETVIRSIELLHAHQPTSQLPAKYLEEYASSLLLRFHPHNYADHIKRQRVVGPRIVADAQYYIREHADRGVTPTEVASFFECSLSALQQGFEQHLGLSLHECIYASRVAKARDVLLDSKAEAYVDVLRSSGFIRLSRFDVVYSRLYGEAPSDTLRCSSQPTGLAIRSNYLDPEKTELLRQHILNSLSQTVKISDLADFVGMSPTRFRIAFKNSFGMPPSQYIMFERLNWAEWLIANTGKSIAAIAGEVGFSSQAHLTTALKKHRGLTPGERRKRVTL